jgi:hypothetical protein
MEEHRTMSFIFGLVAFVVVIGRLDSRLPWAASAPSTAARPK